MFLRSANRIQIISKLRFPNLRQVIAKHRFHTSAVTCVKKYEHTETLLTFGFLPKFEALNVAECKQSKGKFMLEKSYDHKSPEELVSAFSDLSFHCMETETLISNDEYDDLVRNLIDNLPNLNDEQLIKVLYDLRRFPETPNTFSKNFCELWNALDDECYDRTKDWNQQMLLRVCFPWVRLNLAKINQFTRKALTKILRRVDRLTPKELVATMFYVNISRQKMPLIETESRMYQVLDDLNINEIGVICLAFFKTEVKMKHRELTFRIYDKTIEAVETIPDITIVNILKTLRYCSDPSHASKMIQLSDALLPHVDKFGTISCLHIGLLGTTLQYCHQKLMEAIVTRFDRDLKTTRLKEIERITFVLGLFDFKSKSGIEKQLLNKIVDEMKSRVKEITMHPKCLSANAHYLSICGIYDEELIKSVLNEDFIKFAYGKNLLSMGRELLCLDSLTRINLKDTYDGPRLTEKMRIGLAIHQSDYVPFRAQRWKMSHSDQLLLNVKEALEKVYGPNVLTHVLPHYQRPDIVVCFDENSNPVTEKFEKTLTTKHKGDIVSKEFIFAKQPELSDKISEHKFVAVVLGGWNFFLRDTDIPTGGLRVKLEQLEMVGYKPVLIHWKNWQKLVGNEQEMFIRREIEKALNS